MTIMTNVEEVQSSVLRKREREGAVNPSVHLAEGPKPKSHRKTFQLSCTRLLCLLLLLFVQLGNLTLTLLLTLALPTAATTKPSPNPRGRPRKSLEQASTSTADPEPVLFPPGPLPPIPAANTVPDAQLQILYPTEWMDAQGEEGEGEVKRGKGKTGPAVQRSAPKKVSVPTTKKKAAAAGKAAPKKTAAVAGKR